MNRIDFALTFKHKIYLPYVFLSILKTDRLLESQVQTYQILRQDTQINYAGNHHHPPPLRFFVLYDYLKKLSIPRPTNCDIYHNFKAD